MSRLNPEYVFQTLSELQRLHAPVFGSEAHSFRLNPSSSEAEVLAFETTHGILLPADYREFLIKIGNGGAGPFYGIFPLGFADHVFDVAQWHENDGLVGDLSDAFPFTTEWNDLTGMPDDDLAASERYEQMEVFEERYWSLDLINGSIPICHIGCAIRIYLVITGPEAGYLWEDRRAEYKGIKPLMLRDGSKATFATWYKEWLVGCLAAAHNTM